MVKPARSFIQDGLSSCTFKNIGQVHHIKQTVTCASKNLIYMIQCRKCKNTLNAPAEYIGQTKRTLRDRFGEHRTTQNKTTDAAPQHFNPRRGQSIKIDFGKPFDKSITIDINHVNVIDCIDQSIKIDTHNSSGNYCYRCYRWMSIVHVFNL